MIFSESAERSSERPRDLLADNGTVTIFNPLCVTHMDSVLPNKLSVCLAISVMILTQKPIFFRRSLLFLRTFFVFAVSALPLTSAFSMYGATLFVGFSFMFCFVFIFLFGF